MRSSSTSSSSSARGSTSEKVATGEHWLARRAKDLGLCDELMTSDDYLLASERASRISSGSAFEARKRLATRLAEAVAVFTGGAEAALWASARDRRLSL